VSWSSPWSPMACCQSRWARLIIDGKYLESIIEALSQRTGRGVDLRRFLRGIEVAFRVRLRTKHLIQGAFNAQLTAFHTTISHPDGAHIKV
jgi:hypothetical protein